MIAAIWTNPVLPIIAGLVLGMAGLAVALFVWRTHKRRFLATHGPTFVRLCDGLGVGQFDRWRLRRLADRAGLITPAVLVISRGAFEDALRRASVRPEARWPAALRTHLFTGNEELETSTAPT